MKYTIIEYPGLGFEVVRPFVWLGRCNAVSDYYKFETEEAARAWIEKEIKSHQKRVVAVIEG